MELVFEMLSGKQFVPTEVCQKVFTQAGGVIGRGEDCDWIDHQLPRRGVFPDRYQQQWYPGLRQWFPSRQG
jgi:hypothetical protein